MSAAADPQPATAADPQPATAADPRPAAAAHPAPSAVAAHPPLTVPAAPVLCRRTLHRELRRLRERADLTGRQVAAALGWSVAKVSRLERAEIVVREAEVRAVCALYGATAEQTAALAECAARCRAPRWWHAREFRALPPGSDDYLGLEDTASAITLYAPQTVPVLLRTDEYDEAAAALTPAAPAARSTPGTPGTPEDPAAHAVRAAAEAGRRRRQALGRPRGAPRVLVVLEEAVLYRVVGDPEVLHRQLWRLADLGRTPGVRLRVVPFGQADALPLGGPFSLLGHDEDTPPVVAVDQPDGPRLVEDEASAAGYRAALRLLLARIPDAAGSRDLLGAALRRAGAAPGARLVSQRTHRQAQGQFQPARER